MQWPEDLSVVVECLVLRTVKISESELFNRGTSNRAMRDLRALNSGNVGLQDDGESRSKKICQNKR
jgi:hypothetical protein